MSTLPETDEIERRARANRLRIVQHLYNKGMLHEDDARDLLRRPLDPDDPATARDDSALLVTRRGPARPGERPQ